MMRTVLAVTFAAAVFSVNAQTVSANLARAWTLFESDSQLRSAIASIYVLDANTGSVIFDRNARIGLAPASTQKIITAGAAYELLGKNFRYQTTFSQYSGLEGNPLPTGIVITPSGDPTLGSWRWKSTGEDSVAARVIRAVTSAGMTRPAGLIVDARGWEGEAIPGGWIWDDIGNYYGAGATSLNWRENQYDLVLKSGDTMGAPVTVLTTRPAQYFFEPKSAATAGAKGSGDNAYIYFKFNQPDGVVRGTIPAGEKSFYDLRSDAFTNDAIFTHAQQPICPEQNCDGTGYTRPG